jgi:hypothetical protein
MASVFDRPMFQNNTAARNRLNDIAGIERFDRGGPVESPLQQRRVVEAGQLGDVIRSGLGTAADYTLGVLSGTGNNIYGAAADVLSPAFATLGATSLAAELERKSDIAYNAARANIQNGYSATSGMTAADFDMEPADFDFAVARALADARNTPKTSRTGLATPGDRQIPMPRTKEDLSKATAAAPVPTDMEADARGQYRMFDKGKIMTAADLPAFKGRLENQAGPSGMEAEARKLPQGPQGAPVSQKGPTTMEADARGRKPLVSNPAELVTGLNDPAPEVREKTAADFAKQFADMGPKYEGIDKGLLLAQIGFAIAAGDSPNAMSNIADGLSLGADMAIKDKAAKAEFDRQIQLTAMQYGLEKYDQEQQRAKEPIKFVALTDTTYEGKKVPAGTAVYIPYGKIEKNGGMVPPGFGDTEMISALATKKSAMLELMQKTYEQGLIDDSFLASETKTYSEAASAAISAQRALDYLDSAMLQVGQGGVTGLEASAKSIAAKVASAAGLPDVAAQFTDRDEFVATMKLAFQEMMPASLSGVQSANSISNFDVTMMAEAFADAALKDGVFSLAFVSDDTLLNQLKAASNKMQSARQQSLATMGGVEKAFSGRYLRSGTIDNPVSALTALDPYKSILGEQTQTSTPSQFGSLVLGENGVYEIVIPER